MIILAVSSLVGVVSSHSVYWFFPFIFAGMMIFGFVMKIDFILDFGALFSVLSFLFVNRGWLHAFSFSRLLVIIGVFFLYMLVWFYSRGVLYYQEIQKSSQEEEASPKPLLLKEISGNLGIGTLLSVLASTMAIYSSLGIARGEFLQMVIFSTVVFFTFVLAIVLLSKAGN